MNVYGKAMTDTGSLNWSLNPAKQRTPGPKEAAMIIGMGGML